MTGVPARTLVVVPSLTFPSSELAKIEGIEFYEQRNLHALFALEDPRTRVVFVSSLRVEEPVVDDYLSRLPDPRSAADRLYFVALYDPSTRSLAEKLLEDERSLARVAELAEGRVELYTFTTTPLEARIAQRIGARLLGPDPGLAPLGSKTGSRRAGRAAGVEIPPGKEGLGSVVEVERALHELADAGATAAVIKLNNGFSGQGNAVVDLRRLGTPVTDTPTVFCAAGESWATYGPKIETEGGVVEVLLERGGGSPSAQLRIDADGRVLFLSTHDQVLGGPDDQVYLGCRFPARPEYRAEVAAAAARVGEVLAVQGVRGALGMDFVIRSDAHGDPQPVLCEINLRLGGTTHPFAVAHHVTGGDYDPHTNELLVEGSPVHYFATDNLKSDAYKGMEPGAVIDTIERAGLAFKRSTGIGVTLHLLGAVKKYGKLGMVCIGRNRPETDDLFQEAVAALDRAGS